MGIKDHLSTTFADSIHGCGGFVEASSSLIKARKPTDVKLDYSHITVELRTVDGLLKDSTQCAPNGYFFVPVYDKVLFLILFRRRISLDLLHFTCSHASVMMLCCRLNYRRRWRRAIHLVLLSFCIQNGCDLFSVTSIIV
nr:uncharacterized protein LOC108169799 [Malus domestica]